MPVYGVAPGPFVEGAVSAAEPVAGSIGVPSLATHPVETAFVFSGGGNRGACQVGMLRGRANREIGL